MAVVQAALLGLTAVLLAAQLKPLKPEYAVYLVLAASIGVGFLGLARLGVLLDTAGDRKRDQDPACVSGGVIQDGGESHISQSSRRGSARMPDTLQWGPRWRWLGSWRSSR